MKHKLIIEANDEDGVIRLKRTLQADDAYSALWDIQNDLRNRWKHGDYKHDETYQEVDAIREKFFNILDENGISMDDYY